MLLHLANWSVNCWSWVNFSIKVSCFAFYRYYFFIKETPHISSILFLTFFLHWKPGKQKSKNKHTLIFRWFFSPNHVPDFLTPPKPVSSCVFLPISMVTAMLPSISTANLCRHKRGRCWIFVYLNSLSVMSLEGNVHHLRF